MAKSLTKKQSFVDLGCGNGLLVYILTSEGVSYTHTHTNTHCANRHFPVNMEIFGHILTSKLPGGACIMYSFCYLTF